LPTNLSACLQSLTQLRLKEEKDGKEAVSTLNFTVQALLHVFHRWLSALLQKAAMCLSRPQTYLKSCGFHLLRLSPLAAFTTAAAITPLSKGRYFFSVASIHPFLHSSNLPGQRNLQTAASCCMNIMQQDICRHGAWKQRYTATIAASFHVYPCHNPAATLLLGQSTGLTTNLQSLTHCAMSACNKAIAHAISLDAQTTGCLQCEWPFPQQSLVSQSLM